MFGLNPRLDKVKEWINDHSESNDESQGKAAGCTFATFRLVQISLGRNRAFIPSPLVEVSHPFFTGSAPLPSAPWKRFLFST